MRKIRWGEFVRQPAGSVEMVEVSLKDRNRLSATIQSYAQYANAKVQVTLVNGFNMQHKPVYLLRVEVIRQGEPKKTSGRKKPGDTDVVDDE